MSLTCPVCAHNPEVRLAVAFRWLLRSLHDATFVSSCLFVSVAHVNTHTVCVCVCLRAGVAASHCAPQRNVNLASASSYVPSAQLLSW
jgi:hypothetical protein